MAATTPTGPYVVPCRMAKHEKEALNSSERIRVSVPLMKNDQLYTAAHLLHTLVAETPDWMLLFALRCKRFMDAPPNKKRVVVLCFGTGYEIVVLLEGATLPADLHSIARVSIVASVGSMETEASADVYLVNASDALYEHVRTGFKEDPKGQLVINLHDNRANFPLDESPGSQQRKRCFRLWVDADDPLAVGRLQEVSFDSLLSDREEKKAGRNKKAPISAASAPAKAAAAEKPSATPAKAAAAEKPPAKELPPAVEKPAAKPPPTTAVQKPAAKPPPTTTMENPALKAPPPPTTAAAPAPASVADAPASKRVVVAKKATPAKASSEKASKSLLLGFRPREVILLERAFNEVKVAPTFDKWDVSKCTDTDLKVASSTVKHLQMELEAMADEGGASGEGSEESENGDGSEESENGSGSEGENGESSGGSETSSNRSSTAPNRAAEKKGGPGRPTESKDKPESFVPRVVAAVPKTTIEAAKTPVLQTEETAEPVKKKRGRPLGSKNKPKGDAMAAPAAATPTGPVVASVPPAAPPATATPSAETNENPKKRGRQKGSKNKPKDPAPTAGTVSTVAAIPSEEAEPPKKKKNRRKDSKNKSRVADDALGER